MAIDPDHAADPKPLARAKPLHPTEEPE